MIYILTTFFPEEEKFGLVSQLRRASVSIVSNIAEGTSRSSLKDQIRFTEIAYSSALETYCQFIISMDLESIEEKDFDPLKIVLYDKTAKHNRLNIHLNLLNFKY